MKNAHQQTQGLYSSRFEHDNCGIGAIVNIKGKKTHETVENALSIVENLEHRAGKDAEGKTGDGVGILLQISHKFFSKACKSLAFEIGEEKDYGIGMFFFSQDEFKRKQAMKMFEIIVEKEGLEFLGWRALPTNPDVLGSKAIEVMPSIWQGFIKRPADVEKGLAFDRELFIIRKVFEQSNDDTYVVSLSSRTIVYKGMFLVGQLRTFFADLCSKDYDSAIALVHSRFSTNTNPSWHRAHPNRLIVHNGEINTIRGNADKMLAREENMASKYFESSMQKVIPVVDTNGSDSAMLDNTLEFLVMSGMELPLAVMITIPEPWSNNKLMSREKHDFYQYYATMMEPWDGPASILFSDGDIMGAVLDRNGLRPSRYYITNDDYLILSSEVGVLDIDPSNIKVKERLRPGRMLLVDTIQGRVIDDEEIKETYAAKQPYGEWLDNNLIQLRDLKIPNEKIIEYKKDERAKLQRAFGYTYEDFYSSILNMARDGSEPIAAMGADVPLAAISKQHVSLFDYFKQLFAQVTNPPIDAIREKIITATTIYVGKDGNILEAKPENCKMLCVNNPILTNTDLLKIKNLKKDGFKTATIPIIYYKNTSLKKAIYRMNVEADRAQNEGADILILSDRGVDENHIAIPSLLAVSAMQQHLVKTKKYTSVSMILESGEPRTVHHFATILGYGACAINPYLAQDTIKELINIGLLEKDYYAAVEDYNQSIISGIVKIASKMGISTLRSYQGAKIFEAIGISKDVIEEYFPDTVSRVGGISLEDIENDINKRHTSAFDPLGLTTDTKFESVGNHKYRSGKEEHLYNPKTIHLLQLSTRNNDYKTFKEYSALINEEMDPITIRGNMDFLYPEKGIPIEEVESVESIVKRFKTGAMSYGSLSQEAHEALAIAMNTIGGRSNSGEGGESVERLTVGKNGVNKCSAIKQVASGRFGVTSKYLVSAKEIQIKMAQGAKPGEGGHLPGGKVYPWIAKTRLSTPGVSLISPPPHHDIYSIEDLAQLIYDLKSSNSQSRISVKLVSEAGVGTVAAGVAKAGGEVILISGYDGGTGAAAKSSIHNAGLPWELGLAETHQTLIKNGLRNKVVVETDGKLMTGRDVAIACLLGAEEFGFATAPLVTLGCVMMRVCNLDTCPVGVATQNPELRKRFAGKPEYVINFMRFIAEELREYMAKLGLRNLDEMCGRSDLITQKHSFDNGKVGKLDLSALINNPYAQTEKMEYEKKNPYDFEFEKTLDQTILMKELMPALKKKQKRSLAIDIKNTNSRTFGTMFGAEITKLYEDTLEDDMYTIQCNGNGGQSFGAFIPKGLTIEVVGDSNDYFGKGLSGGKLIIYPPKGSNFKYDENIIIGNVAFYGATSGEAYINGVAGERFCVRNSGVKAVVEGVGDHGCEYMTGGRVVILGNTGKNFAAGMSGGIAYVLDEENKLYLNMNKELVDSEKVTDKYDVLELKQMIKKHVAYTNSEKGKRILDHFSEYLPKFKKIMPRDYKKMLSQMVQMERKGLSIEQAQIEAFYELKK